MRKVKDFIESAGFFSGMSKTRAGKAIGLGPIQVSRKFKNNTLKADEFIKMIDAMGMRLELADKGTGEIKRIYDSEVENKALKGMSNGVKYNTNTAKMIAKNGNIALYVTRGGDYFFADFSKKKITAADSSVAESFDKIYGIRK